MAMIPVPIGLIRQDGLCLQAASFVTIWGKIKKQTAGR